MIPTLHISFRTFLEIPTFQRDFERIKHFSLLLLLNLLIFAPIKNIFFCLLPFNPDTNGKSDSSFYAKKKIYNIDKI